MTRRARALALVAALAGAAVAGGVAAPAATAAPAPPQLADAHGLTVIAQPEWAEGSDRTFTFTVGTEEVPAYPVMPGQVSGEHVVMVTLPEGYDGGTEYPVHYTLHGGGDYPDAPWLRDVVEEATADEPLITVAPNGGGRGWYTDWVYPGGLGAQNWETFHLEQLIPFIDANLATVEGREGRAVSGHSMGGFGAFGYAERRPDLFGYVGSFSGGLDLLNQEMRAAVLGSTQLAAYGTPTVALDAVFGTPIWPFDGTWNRLSPAQHVESLRGMGVALYVGDGGDLTVNPVQAIVENRARVMAVVTADHLDAAGIPHEFLDYGDGSSWAPGCTGKHAQLPCLRADMHHFVSLIMDELEHP
ncbi:esterase family protein [Glycomyces sp. A-F 0318]|uniref:alpha/beta hydrolase n=1 Tax=Glycomyces amatae TaxID=2881355 RepID=UPI001E6348C8|nr:esterase family protein [Glycomyces amatae]